MNLAAVVQALNQIAPLELAEDWDNTGLLLTPTVAPEVRRVLLTIDTTRAVVAEAVDLETNLIISYHPPIFSGLKRLVPTERAASNVIRLLEHRISVYSPHTALDAAAGGVNDWLCEAFGPGKRAAIQPRSLTATQTTAKVGMGRRVELSQPIQLEDAVAQAKQYLGLPSVRLAAAPEHRDGVEIRTVAVCAGAGGSVLSECTADLLLTGEMRHHDVLARVEAGTSVILTEHTNSERGYLPTLRQRLLALCPGLDVALSERDTDPLTPA